MTSSSNPRHVQDMRQLGGILFVLGVCAMVFPLKDSVTIVGKDGTYTAMQIALLVGDLCVLVLGLLCMFVGYQLTVRDAGSPTLTLAALIWEQTVFIEWITGMVNLGKNMAPFGDGSTNFYFTTGFLTMFFLCFLLYGSIGLILFAIYSHQTGATRTPQFYKGRLAFYSFIFFAVGLFRFLLPGSKVLSELGNGPLDKPKPVVGGPIWFPEIDIFLGVTTMILGMWGIVRGVVGPTKGALFGNLVWGNFVLYVTLKVMVQIGYFPGEGPAGAAAMVSIVFLPGHILLAFLDDKAQEESTSETTTPSTKPGDETEPAKPAVDEAEEVGEPEHAKPTTPADDNC